MSLQAPVVHLELHTNDLSSARDLYGELCGWTPDRVDTRHGSYLALDMGRAARRRDRRELGAAAAVAARTSRWATSRAATDRALSLGARCCSRRVKGPPGGARWSPRRWVGELAFWQQKPSR